MWLDIDPATGELVVKDADLFDYESNFDNNLLPLQIRAFVQDNGTPGKI